MLYNLHSNPCVFWCNETQYFLSIVYLKKESRCIPLWPYQECFYNHQRSLPSSIKGQDLQLALEIIIFNFFNYSHSSIPRQNLGSIMLNSLLQRFFYANAFMNGNGLHERRKNLREKGFSLVDMENLEMEGILKERCFWSGKNNVLWNCSVKHDSFWRKIHGLKKPGTFICISSYGISQIKFQVSENGTPYVINYVFKALISKSSFMYTHNNFP